MNLSKLPDDPRLHELLAGRVLDDLDASEQRELNELAARHGIDLNSLDDSSLDLAAGAVLAAGMSRSSEPLPSHLRERLFRAADEFLAGQHDAVTMGAPPVRPEVVGRISPAGLTPVSSSDWSSRVGWLAAAAAVVLAVLGWLRPGPTGAPSPASPVALLDGAPDVVRASWGDWDKPEIPGVKGEVVWSDSRQAGYMKFSGLPANDPRRQQYQLWIVDERGLVDPTGQSARISGGVFDAPEPGPDGTVVVPIKPALKVGKAQLFALTIEKPGGTWVSDMSRRVAIASVGKS